MVTIADWLKLYDSGEEVESVCMDGFGMGYELAIQDLAVAILREIASINLPDDISVFREILRIERNKCSFALDAIHQFSNNQENAAAEIAAVFWRNTPPVALDKMRVQDITRIIKLQKIDGVMTIKGNVNG